MTGVASLGFPMEFQSSQCDPVSDSLISTESITMAKPLKLDYPHFYFFYIH